MKRPELSPPEMFRQMLAPDPEDTDEAALPPDAASAGLSPEEAGVTHEELQEIEHLDDTADLKVRQSFVFLCRYRTVGACIGVTRVNCIFHLETPSART